MAAGLGFKTFNTGDVLTAADTNGYLMQGVWVFANATARTSAVTSPQEGNVSFLKDTNSFEIYDGTEWVAYGSGDITGVTAGTGISGGGTTGTVTVTNSMATAIDAKGDLIVGTGSDTFDRLAVGGTNGHVLTVDSSTSTGLKWAAAAGGGKILQVVSATNTGTQSTSSTSFVDATTVSITPSAATSKCLIMAYISGASDTAASQIGFRLVRDSTAIFVGDASGNRTQATGILFNPSNANYSSQAATSFLDSPSTTSAITYKLQYKADAGSSTTVYLGRTYNDSNADFTYRTPSAGIIVMEVGA